MKSVLFILSALLFFPGPARADVKLDAPEVLLQRARENRIACREVVLDLSKNATDFREPNSFNAYFAILPALDQLARDLNLDAIYPNAVKTLGEIMAENGLRWLSPSTDTPERILYFHHWMSKSSVHDFLSTAQFEERNLTPAQLVPFAVNIDALIAWVDSTYPLDSDLRLGYRELISERAAKVLAQPVLTEEARLFWLSQLFSASGYGSVLTNLNDQLIGVGPQDSAIFHVLLQRLATLASRIRSENANLPSSVKTQLGDVALAAAMHGPILGEPFSESEFAALLTDLEPHHLQTLAQEWIGLHPTHAYLGNFVRYTSMILQALQERDLVDNIKELSRFLAKIAAPAKAVELGLEGTWTVQNEVGAKYKLMVAFVTATKIFVALSDENHYLTMNYFSLAYQPDQNAFLASEHEPLDDPSQNFQAKLKIMPGNEIEVEDLARRPGHPMRGKKTEIYPDYFPFPAHKVDPTGIYEGQVQIVPNSRISARLTVTVLNAVTTARLEEIGSGRSIDLNVGSDAEDGALYLTTGSITGRATWFQLRGAISNGEYRGNILRGGFGLTPVPFVLKKVSR